jgi:hypothetical protein
LPKLCRRLRCSHTNADQVADSKRNNNGLANRFNYTNAKYHELTVYDSITDEVPNHNSVYVSFPIALTSPHAYSNSHHRFDADGLLQPDHDDKPVRNAILFSEPDKHPVLHPKHVSYGEPVADKLGVAVLLDQSAWVRYSHAVADPD